MSGLEIAAIAATVASTAVAAQTARNQGKSAQAQLDAEAKEIESQAQRAALERRKEGALLESRQRAVAAAQGGASDPSIIRLFGETAAETEKAAATELTAGRAGAQGARYRGQVARAQGSASATGSLLSGAGSLASSKAVKSAFDRFGGSGGDSSNQNSYRYGGLR